ncbi:MAG: NACHT domain-containing protein, partial [Gammaproteobacteria bacterium]
MIDYLTYLGVSSAWSFVFRPIIEDLAKDSAKDFIKDFCKESLNHVFVDRDEWQRAVTKALKEFLEQFESELIGAGEDELTCKAYSNSLKSFLQHEKVRSTLGSTVLENRSADANQLAQIWGNQNLERLPNDFSWERLCRIYQNKARAILRDSEELRNIIDSISQEKSSESLDRLSGINPGFDTAKYAEGLRKRYGYLKLESLDPNPDHQPIRLTRIFVEQSVRSCQQFNPRVYELPIEHRRRLKEKGALDRELDEEALVRQRESYLQQEPRPVLEVIVDPTLRLIVILGDPGSGKSMLLNTLAMQWAEQRPVERDRDRLPLLIELKAYISNQQENHCRDFLEYLDHGPGAAAHLNQMQLDTALQRGNAYFLLDGLDEIFDPNARQELANQLVRLSVRYEHARFIVTSRIIGYDLVAPILRSADFQHFVLQELDEPQQKCFLERWHQLAYRDEYERENKLIRLRTSIREVPAIRELAENPLLITLMALLNRHQELPRDRNELYEQASRILLQQWDASKALQEDSLLEEQSLDYKDKQAILRVVAMAMQTGPTGLAGNVISEQDLENTLTEYLSSLNYEKPKQISKRLIRQLRDRNFILCLLGDDYFAFVHRTFLEFFCAWAWVWKFEKEKSIDFNQLKLDTFDAHWQDERWHEVLRLISSRLEPNFAGQLIDSLFIHTDSSFRFTNIFLAGKCYQDLRNSAVLPDLTNRLEVILKNLVHFDLPFFYESWEDERTLVYEVRHTAMQAIVNCWPQNTTIRQWLRTCAQNTDEAEDVRSAAVQALARGWKEDPETLTLIKALAQNIDEAKDVRSVAVQALAFGWKGDQNILTLVKALAQNTDEAEDVRSAAVQALAFGWKEDRETLTFVKALAQNADEAKDVRSAAVQALAFGWKGDQDILTLVKALAQNTDEAEDVRWVAVQVLAFGWKEDPETLTLIKALAQNIDEAKDVRSAAVDALGRRWKEDRETLTLVKALAQNTDEKRFVRSAAVDA